MTQPTLFVPLEDAARAYLQASYEIATARHVGMGVLVRRDDAFHQMILAAGFDCWLCDEGCEGP